MPTLRALALAASTLVAFARCAPNPAAPVKVMALALTDGGVYAPSQVELATVTDVVELRGSVASLIGAARIVLDSQDPRLDGPLTDQQLLDILLQSKGTTVHTSFLSNNDVLWPADFHSWNMVTTYYNFEQAYNYFRGTAQVPVEQLGNSNVYYFPVFILRDQGPDPLTDNALFFPAIQGFVILPFNNLQLVPLSMNSGVLAHEFSHRVFNKQVHQGAAIPAVLSHWITAGPTPAFNLLRSMDEGLADYHAVGASCFSAYGCFTRFLAPSLGDSISAGRDVGQNHCMTASLRTALTTSTADVFSNGGLQYQVGTLLATSLWQAGERVGQRQALQRAVLASYTDPSSATLGFQQLIAQDLNAPQNFTLGVVANSILQHVSNAALKMELCNQFLDHLQVRRNELPDCPPSAPGGHTCPNIN